MTRELLAEGHFQYEGQPHNDVYAAAANVAMGELVERLKKGVTYSPTTRVENVHLHDAEGHLTGFRLYLVDGDGHFGPPKVEVLGG